MVITKMSVYVHPNGNWAFAPGVPRGPLLYAGGTPVDREEVTVCNTEIVACACK